MTETGAPFTPAQVAQLTLIVKESVQEALGDAGLRIESGDHQDEARRDFMFIRAMRKGVNGLAVKIGWAVIIAVLAGAGWVFQAGLSVWNKGG